MSSRRSGLGHRLRGAGVSIALALLLAFAGSALGATTVAAGPAVSLVPASLTFADQLVLTKSAAQTVTLTNSGNAPLNITAIALTGTNAGDYKLAGTCTAPLTIAAGGSCTIDVTFAPLDGVPTSAAVQVTDGAGGTHSVTLSGNGVDPPLTPLSTVSLNLPPNLGDFVRDQQAAIRLGKALFWDMQSGSDGVTACATCHFNAGADSRPRNQLNPGKLPTGQPNVFVSPSGANYDLSAADFPFHQLANPDDRNSAVLRDTTQVSGSHGVVPSKFLGIELGNPVDLQDFAAPGVDSIFNINGINTRRPTGRNTPSAINAVFNFRNFWDGRAQNDFNGVNPFGSRDADAKVLEADAAGNMSFVRMSLKNSSLASQAVGPPGNAVEMSADGRDLRDIGKKLLGLQPLARQLVDSSDSVLQSLSNSPNRGLHTTYSELVQQAFVPKWWNSSQIVTFNADGTRTIGPNPGGELAPNQFTQMQSNFSLFWGLSIMLYESTLVSDQTRFDQFLAGNKSALTAQEQEGLAIFQGKGLCQNCHGGPELTNASVSRVENEKLETMIMGNGQLAVYDNGFYNIGVRQTGEDVGLGGNDPFGKPLSMTKRALAGDPNACGSSPCNPGPGTQRAAVTGSFKVPALRNLALTAPYFHNGGQLTIRQVVDFYNRGADFAKENIDDFDVEIGPLGLTGAERDALVAFLRALTDPRAENQRAPFDHPQLFVPNGHEFVEGHHRFDDMRIIGATGTGGGAPIARFPAVPGIAYVSNLQVTCNTPAPSFSLFQGNTRVSATVLDNASAPPPTTMSAAINTDLSGAFTIALTGFDLAGHSQTAACPYEVTPTLVGDERVLGKADYNPAGLAEAFRTAPADLTGTLGKLTIYLDTGSEATRLVVGIYGHNTLTNKPDTLLATGTTTAPAAGGWNTISVSSAQIEAGKRYWIAFLSPAGAGTVRFRDDFCCNTLSGPAETSLRTDLSQLPATWATGQRFKDAPLSAFASRP